MFLGLIAECKLPLILFLKVLMRKDGILEKLPGIDSIYCNSSGAISRLKWPDWGNQMKMYWEPPPLHPFRSGIDVHHSSCHRILVLIYQVGHGG